MKKVPVKPAWLMMFITVTFGGIATFLPLYSIENGVTGIQLYFLLYALALMFTRTFAGKLYDKKGHQAVFIPGALLILTAMLLLSWLPNNAVLYTAALLYGTGFGVISLLYKPGLLHRPRQTDVAWLMLPFFPFLI